MSATINQAVSGNVTIKLDPSATVTFEWATGVDAILSRGVTDTDRTTLSLRSPNGTRKYILIADDNTVTASSTAP